MMRTMQTWKVWCNPKCTKLLRKCSLMWIMKTMWALVLPPIKLLFKDSPPPDPKLSDYIPFFEQGKARKVERRDDIIKKFDEHGQEDVMQVIASSEEEKSEEGLPEGVSFSAERKMFSAERKKKERFWWIFYF